MELRWLGPILDCSGYASAARGYLQACEAAGIAVQARDRSRSISLKNRGMGKDVLEMYERLKDTRVAADCPTVQHQVPDVFFDDRKARTRIGYTIFEMTRIPRTWASCCNKMDVIWTGSEYSRDAFLASGVKIPVEVLPHAIDVEKYNPMGPKWQIENRRAFAFISVFDFTARKGWKDLLKAYWTAFSNKDDVCLILKCYFGDFSEESRKDIIRRIAKYRNEIRMDDRAPVLVYGHDIDSSDMPALYRSADCYVGISREGFGLSYAEAMACGLPCIAPEIGGTRQFMDRDCSYLIRYQCDELIDRELVQMFPSFEGLYWAKHDWEHLAELMVRVVEDAEDRKNVAQAGRLRIERDLSYAVVGERIKKLLS